MFFVRLDNESEDRVKVLQSVLQFSLVKSWPANLILAVSSLHLKSSLGIIGKVIRSMSILIANDWVGFYLLN